MRKIVVSNHFERTCPSCGITKGTTAFRKRSGKNSHLWASSCNACVTRKQAKYNEENREKTRDSSLIYAHSISGKRNRHEYWERIKNKPETMFRIYRARSKKREISFSLSYEEFVKYFNRPCYYCGDEINGIGLDRVDSSQGYNAENIVSCCHFCNFAKLNFSQKDFFGQIEKIYLKHIVKEKSNEQSSV